MITNKELDDKLADLVQNTTELEKCAFRLGYKTAMLDKLEIEVKEKQQILSNLGEV